MSNNVMTQPPLSVHDIVLPYLAQTCRHVSSAAQFIQKLL